MRKKYVVFKPRERDRSFVLSVVFMTAKMLLFVVLLIGISCSGLVAGLGKAWVDTTPDLDVLALGMLHMDMVAAQKGLQPIHPAFWNTF